MIIYSGETKVERRLQPIALGRRGHGSHTHAHRPHEPHHEPHRDPHHTHSTQHPKEASLWSSLSESLKHGDQAQAQARAQEIAEYREATRLPEESEGNKVQDAQHAILSEHPAAPADESAPMEFANTTAGHLHRQLHHFYPQKVMLVATFATHEMMSFVYNWWEHAARASIPNRLVIAMDKETLEVCRVKGMPAVGVAEFFDFEGCKVLPCCACTWENLNS